MDQMTQLKKRLAAALAVLFTAAGIGLAAASTASAAPATPMGTAAVTTQRMSAATLNVRQAGWYAAGTSLRLSCYARGQSVQGHFSSYIPGGWDNLWYRVADGFWVADVDIETGSNDPVTGPCPTRVFKPTAAGQSAVEHAAEADWVDPDCTFFASRTWWEAGLSQTPSWRAGSTASGNIYGATVNAVNANSFKNYVVTNGLATITPTPLPWSEPSAGGAQLGDVIGYDWDGNAVLDHLGIVIGFEPTTGRPLLAMHGTAPRVRYWNIGSTGQTYPQMNPGYRAWLIHEIG